MRKYRKEHPSISQRAKKLSSNNDRVLDNDKIYGIKTTT